MALADYFDRNAQAAAALVQGFDAMLLGARLEQEVIGLAYDSSAELRSEGQAAIDLTLRLISRLYPKVVVSGLPGTKPATFKRYLQLARSINPRIEVSKDVRRATKLLVFGSTKVTGNKKAQSYTWYVGSENWVAKLSKSAPVGSGSSQNPLGAGAAACVGVANIFRSVFIKELGGVALDDEVETSLLDLRPVTPTTENPSLCSVKLNDVHLVGAGAIGNGALWAFSRLPCEGELHVVDHESVADSNLQRYVMLVDGDRAKQKAVLAADWFKQLKSKLSVVPHAVEWSTYVSSIAKHNVDTVISAVDTAKARIEIQSSLPRVIYNGWTQRGEAGVSRHWFCGEKACLACLYIPTGQAPSEDVVVSRALCLGEDETTVREVRRRLQLFVPTDRDFLQRIALGARISVEKIAGFENRPLRELYVEGVCGGAVMEFRESALLVKAEVPMGFQSALAGILLAAEFARPIPLPDTITQIDLLGTFPERPGNPRAKTLFPRCMCLDDDFVEAFRKKYPSSCAV